MFHSLIYFCLIVHYLLQQLNLLKGGSVLRNLSSKGREQTLIVKEVSGSTYGMA